MLEDLTFSLMSALPARCKMKPALIPCLRKRFEFIWIQLLNASLNMKRWYHFTFPGDYSARTGEAEEDEVVEL